MKKILTIGICTLMLLGCSATNDIASLNGTCAYDKMPGNEFIYTGNPKYLSNFFEDDSGFVSGVNSIANDIYNKKFKFSGNTKPIKPNGYLYPQVKEVQGKYYAFASNVHTAVLFEGCQEALWFKGHTNYDDLLEMKHFKRADGQAVSQKDLAYAYGTLNVKNADFNPKIEVDEFANNSTISTEFLNGVLLRTWSNAEQATEPKEFQVYAVLTFFDDWGYINSARTKDGKSRDVTKISSNANCNNSHIGCILEESVGVSLPISFLKENKDGFAIKFYGTKTQVINVDAYQVSTMLHWLESI